MNSESALNDYKFSLYEIFEVYHRFCLKLNMSDSTYAILDVLLCAPADNITQKDLSVWLGYPKQTVHSALMKMKDRGLVTVDAGHKNLTVHLTDAGRKKAAASVGRVNAAETAVLSSWSPEDRENLVRLSRKFLHDLDAQEKAFPKEEI